MRLIKELIHRRIPHIIGSYLITGTSLILFVDWLVDRYTLPEYYTTLSLFGVIAIAEIIYPSQALYFPRIGDYFSIKSD